MFIDVYFRGPLPVDRDEIEEILAELPDFEVVGAGAGDTGANIDLEVVSGIDSRSAMRIIADVLDRLGAASNAFLRASDTGEHVAVDELT